MTTLRSIALPLAVLTAVACPVAFAQATVSGAYHVAQTVKTAAKERTLALDASSGDIYVIAPDPASAAATKPLVLLKITK
jgi:hypothetical protein